MHMAALVSTEHQVEAKLFSSNTSDDAVNGTCPAVKPKPCNCTAQCAKYLKPVVMGHIEGDDENLDEDDRVYGSVLEEILAGGNSVLRRFASVHRKSMRMSVHFRFKRNSDLSTLTMSSREEPPPCDVNNISTTHDCVIRVPANVTEHTIADLRHFTEFSFIVSTSHKCLINTLCSGGSVSEAATASLCQRKRHDRSVANALLFG